MYIPIALPDQRCSIITIIIEVITITTVCVHAQRISRPLANSLRRDWVE